MRAFTFFKIEDKGVDDFEIEHFLEEAEARSHAQLLLLTNSYRAIEVVGGTEPFLIERGALTSQPSL